MKKVQEADGQAGVLIRVDEAIGQEMHSVQEPITADDATLNPPLEGEASSSTEPSAQVQTATTTDNDSTASSPDESTYSNDTGLTSPISDDSYTLSSQVVRLAEEQRYAEIPAIFESMLRGKLTPSTEAYNALLVSAIQLTRTTYQAWPKALEVYSDMTRRSVTPNETT